MDVTALQGTPVDQAFRRVRSAAAVWLLVLLAAVPYVLGWLAGVAVQAAVWAWSGLVVGWRDGRETIRKGWST